MTNLLLISSLVLLFVGCKEKEPVRIINEEAQIAVEKDLVIARKVITDEIAGSAYRKRAMGYFTIEKRDTSDILFIFSEAKESNDVSLFFYYENGRSKVTYREKLSQLKKVLPEAVKDFNIDSLSALSISRLVSNGDIAIDITEEFLKTGNQSLDNRHLASFMKESKLAKDMNNVFGEYSLRVKGFSLEKCHFTSRDILYWESAVERDSTTVPKKIIDCLTWITFETDK